MGAREAPAATAALAAVAAPTEAPVEARLAQAERVVLAAEPVAVRLVAQAAVVVRLQEQVEARPAVQAAAVVPVCRWGRYSSMSMLS